MNQSFLAGSRAPPAFRPAWLRVLPAARDRERVGGHVVGDRGSRGDVRALPHRDGRNELRIAADEDAVFDDCRMLGHAVVVARDRAGADVDVPADRRVAQVGKVIRLRSLPHRRLLQLDERPDARARADRALGSHVRERTHGGAVRHRRLDHDRAIEQHHVVADGRVGEANAGVHVTPLPHPRPTLKLHHRTDRRVRADGHVLIDVRRGRILQRDAGEHQRIVLPAPDDAIEIGQIDPRVDAAELARVVDPNGLDRQAASPVDRHEIRQIELPL